MKISELISRLQEQKYRNGDLEVLFGDDNDNYNPTRNVNIHIGPSYNKRVLYITHKLTRRS